MNKPTVRFKRVVNPINSRNTRKNKLQNWVREETEKNGFHLVGLQFGNNFRVQEVEIFLVKCVSDLGLLGFLALKSSD